MSRGVSTGDASPELRVLARWEEMAGWLLEHTGRWPKSTRFTLAQRVQNHALDVVELLVEARYRPKVRGHNLAEANLRLERMRFLLRLAKQTGCGSRRGFESAMRRLDETGRMLHGWRKATGQR